MNEGQHVYTRLCAQCAEKLGRIYELYEHAGTGERIRQCELCKSMGYYSDYDYYTASRGKGNGHERDNNERMPRMLCSNK